MFQIHIVINISNLKFKFVKVSRRSHFWSQNFDCLMFPFIIFLLWFDFWAKTLKTYCNFCQDPNTDRNLRGDDCVRKAMRINWRNCSLDWTWCLLPELWSEAYTTQRQGWLFEGGRANQKANCFDYSSPMSWACQCTQVNVWILHLHTTMAGSCILPIHTLLESKLKQVV